MFKHKNILGLLLILTIFLVAEPLAAQKKGKNKKGKKGISQEQLTEAQDYFIAASKEKILGDDSKAIELFAKSLDIDPNNHAAAYELARIYQEKSDFSKAISYASQAASADGGNQWYQYLYAGLLAEQGSFEDAADIYEKLLKKSPGNPEHYFDFAYMLASSGKLKEAIRTLDMVETIIGVNEETIMQKRELYIASNDIEGSISELKKLSDAFPTDVRYKQMLADAYNQTGQADKATAVYKEMGEKDPDNPYARLAMADHYRKSGDSAKAMEELKAAFASPDMPAEPKLQFLIANLQSMQVEDKTIRENADLAEILCKTHPGDSQGHLIYGHLLMDTERPNEALESYRKSLNINGNQLETWNQVFVLETRNQKFEDLEKDTKTAMEVFPNQSLVYYFNGLANTSLNNYDKAIKSFKRAANIGTANTETLSEIYAQLGDLYNSKSEFDRSDEYFEKALVASPNNSYILNNYSYLLSLREERLEEAAKMSLKSNELEPGNASFQDTYGWIQYQMGTFKEAKLWLEKSMAAGGDQSAVVVDHYGDVLYRMKDVDGAVQYWKQAKSLGLNSETIDRKIQDRKIY